MQIAELNIKLIKLILRIWLLKVINFSSLFSLLFNFCWFLTMYFDLKHQLFSPKVERTKDFEKLIHKLDIYNIYPPHIQQLLWKWHKESKIPWSWVTTGKQHILDTPIYFHTWVHNNWGNMHVLKRIPYLGNLVICLYGYKLVTYLWKWQSCVVSPLFLLWFGMWVS